MAVRIDGEAFRASVDATVAEAADRLVVGELESLGGGAQAEVGDVRAWVGIVDGEIIGVCDCGAERGLCAHAVALALTAIEGRFPLLAAATPPGPDVGDPEQARYLAALRRLTPRQVATLVVEEAVRDRLFAVRLLGEAGLLDAEAAASGLADFRAAVTDAAGPDDLGEAEAAAVRLIEEVEILLAYPASTAALDLVEEAILAADGLAGVLLAGAEYTDLEPNEVSDPLTAAHRELGERLGLDEEELAARVSALAAKCVHDLV